jgi:hypothetical protein
MIIPAAKRTGLIGVVGLFVFLNKDEAVITRG